MSNKTDFFYTWEPEFEMFLATLVALQSTPASWWVSDTAKFGTSLASRLARMFSFFICDPKIRVIQKVCMFSEHCSPHFSKYILEFSRGLDTNLWGLTAYLYHKGQGRRREGSGGGHHQSQHRRHCHQLQLQRLHYHQLQLGHQAVTAS